jgi:alkanesulfonate monooxygenase SsuD/methylene tetrahydromethanopterin reductase-like flavin-dependent oxidoreductase (luciferase family)
MARTVDHISNGRLTLGIGSGWFEKDYTEFGYEFGTAITRLHVFRDAIPVIKERMAIGNPPPVRGKIPIMIGGGGEKVMLKLVAQHADIWHGFTNADTYPHKGAVLDGHCAAVGRDPATVERSSGVEGRDAEAVVANAEALAGLGVTLLTVGCDGPDYDLGPAQALVRWRDSRSAAG